MNPVLIKMLTEMILLAGVAVMSLNILRYRHLIRRKASLQHNGAAQLKSLFDIHLIFKVFFLIGYIGVYIAFVYSVPIINTALVAVIFLFGAIFVMMSIHIQDRMMEKSRETYFNAIRMLVRAVEIRDPYTMGHSEHVANLSMLLYKHLPDHEQKDIDPELLHSTALMHDIGKIGVPEIVLNKTDRLTDDEWNMIRRHTAIGKDLLSKMEVYSSVPDWVAYHHERIDGGGYEGLSNGNIPFAARLLAVTDTFSAIVTNRPYRKGKSYGDAISILKSNAGTQLDGLIVEVFCSIPQDNVEACRPQALVLDFLQEIENMEQRMAQGNQPSRNMVLSADAGERWLRKLADFCKQRGEALSLAVIQLEGVENLEASSGYHAADACVERIGALLIDNIRNTDVVAHCRRDLYIMALPQCSKEEALNLMNRLSGEITGQLDAGQTSSGVRISHQMVFYHSGQDGSWDELMDCFDRHFS